MTALSQEEILSNSKTVVQGLDTLKNEHHQILNSLLNSMKTIKKENMDTNLVEEKTNILKKSIDMIELGLGEAQVGDHECWREIDDIDGLEQHCDISSALALEISQFCAKPSISSHYINILALFLSLFECLFWQKF